MNVKKIRSMKALKLLGLLISAMLIATASAALYSQMFMYSHVTVAAHFCTFVTGVNDTDVSADITAGGEEVTFAGMVGCNGSLITYIGAVNITNTSTTANRTLELKLDTWDGDGKMMLRYINVTMYDTSDESKKGNMLSLLPGTGDVESSGQVLIETSAMWRAQWDVFWWGNATAGTDTVDVKLVLIETA
jgi:hypothetical protein